MGIITTADYARANFPGVKKWFQTGYNDVQLLCNRQFGIESSKQAYELEVGNRETGLAPIKPQGQAVQYDDMEAGFESRYTHVTYGIGLVITREEIEDNLYPKLAARRTAALARSLRITKEIVAANVYNRASNSSFVGADGLPLLSSAHLRKDGGTFSNQLAVAADLSEASLEQACIDIQDFTDERGLRIAAMPKQLYVATQNGFNAERILNSLLQNDTANNAVNALKSLSSIPEGSLVNTFFTDPNAWFLRTDVPDGMKGYSRRKATIEMDGDTDTQNAKYIATERYSFGWSDVRGIFGSAGA